MNKPEFLVSACLAGCKCRYDGSSFPVDRVLELVNSGRAIPFCPEDIGGLKTPRDPCEILVTGGTLKVLGISGADYTREFMTGAELSLKLARESGIKKAILKSRSPSCGCGEIYDGTFSGKKIKGNGITADLFIKNGIRVYTDQDPDYAAE